MQIVLLKNRAQVSHAGHHGYVTEAAFHGHSSIGIVTKAGVFRPITESRELPAGKPLHVQDWYTVLPQFHDLAEALHEQKIVGKRTTDRQQKDLRQA